MCSRGTSPWQSGHVNGTFNKILRVVRTTFPHFGHLNASGNCSIEAMMSSKIFDNPYRRKFPNVILTQQLHDVFVKH